MLALRTSPPDFTVGEAERVARDTYGLAVDITPLSGERDCNFHLRTADGPGYVLKILDAAANPGMLDCQVRVLRHLADLDESLPVPRILATLRGSDLGAIERGDGRYATCLMAYLPGRLLADRPPGAALLEQLGATLARVDRGLQGFFHPALAQHLAWDVRRLPELLEFSPQIDSPAVRDRVVRAADGFGNRLAALRGLRSQAIHGDCHGHNLLVDAGARVITGILDFGDMMHAPVILEPAIAMSELLTDAAAPLDALSALLRAYARDQSLEAADVEALYDLICARHAVTLLVHAWRIRHDHRGARILERAALHAGRSLEQLLDAGRGALTAMWHEAAGTTSGATTAARGGRASGRKAVSGHADAGATGDRAGVPDAADCDRADAGTSADRAGAVRAVTLGRRHRLLGAGAELFYEQPLHFVRGAGVWLYDTDGQAYLDAYNNVPHVGHSHPCVVGAIQRQTALLATHTRYLHAGILDYAERLTARLPPHLNACLFVNSGSEANDVAWRIAASCTGRKGALVMAHAYHGITDAVAALTLGAGQPHAPCVAALTPPPVGARAGDVLESAVLQAAAEDTDRAVHALAVRGFAPAAFFIDSALTSTGVYDPPASWLNAVVARVRAAGGMIVADEVQYGLGRSGSHFWGFERRGIEPDIVTLGKPVGNGYPMGVVIANRSVIEAFQARFGFFSTFGGNPVAAAAGLAVMKVLDDEQLMANARTTGEYLRRRLEALATRHGCFGEVRGAGLLVGVEITGTDARDAKRRTRRILNALASRSRVLAGSEGPEANVLKLRPPMPFRPEHVDLLVDSLDAAAAGAILDDEYVIE